MPTNIYDVTFPPDTQLANLLGSDLRNLALNVQQRMALISGIAASIWNPALDAQPLNWTGLLYFATDTGRVMQWSGPAWVDITGSLFPNAFFKDNTFHNHTGTTSLDTIYTIPIPGNTLVANGIIRTSLGYDPTVQSGAASVITISFGGAPVFVLNIIAALSQAIILTTGNRGATNQQITNTINVVSGSVVGANATTSGVDTTVSQNLTVQIQSGANADTQQFNQIIVEIL